MSSEVVSELSLTGEQRTTMRVRSMYSHRFSISLAIFQAETKFGPGTKISDGRIYENASSITTREQIESLSNLTHTKMPSRREPPFSSESGARNYLNCHNNGIVMSNIITDSVII